MQPVSLKHEHLARILETDIVNGVYEADSLLPSQNVLALRYDVAVSTVREALSALTQKGLIRREQGRGTFVMPNLPVQQHTIGVSARMFSPPLHPYTAYLFEGISQMAREYGFELVMQTEHSEAFWRRLDGLLLNAQTTREIVEVPASLPRVAIMTRVFGIPSVIHDDYQATLDLTQHLIELGHKDIAFFSSWKRGSTTIGERYDAYYDALENAGIPYRAELERVCEPLMAEREPYADSGYRLMKQCLEEGFSATAIMAYNDSMAVGIIKALREAGLRVPQDVSVTGFDGISTYDYFQPTLTTIRVPLSTIGATAVDILHALINREAVPELTVIPGSMVRGASTGPVSTRD